MQDRGVQRMLQRYGLGAPGAGAHEEDGAEKNAKNANANGAQGAQGSFMRWG